MPLHVSSTCAHRQETKIVLLSHTRLKSYFCSFYLLYFSNLFKEYVCSMLSCVKRVVCLTLRVFFVIVSVGTARWQRLMEAIEW
jgi:hypothetical protein